MKIKYIKPYSFGLNFCVYPKLYSEIHLERVLKNIKDSERIIKYKKLLLNKKHENLAYCGMSDSFENFRGIAI